MLNIVVHQYLNWDILTLISKGNIGFRSISILIRNLDVNTDIGYIGYIGFHFICRNINSIIMFHLLWNIYILS